MRQSVNGLVRFIRHIFIDYLLNAHLKIDVLLGYFHIGNGIFVVVVAEVLHAERGTDLTPEAKILALELGIGIQLIHQRRDAGTRIGFRLKRSIDRAQVYFILGFLYSDYRTAGHGIGRGILAEKIISVAHGINTVALSHLGKVLVAVEIALLTQLDDLVLASVLREGDVHATFTAFVRPVVQHADLHGGIAFSTARVDIANVPPVAKIEVYLPLRITLYFKRDSITVLLQFQKVYIIREDNFRLDFFQIIITTCRESHRHAQHGECHQQMLKFPIHLHLFIYRYS